MQVQKYSLENEKKNFLKILCSFIDSINFERDDYFIGRPRQDYGDLIKALLIMSYHVWSYRRANSDITKMYEEGLIFSIPRRSTLCKYMNDEDFKEILGMLVELSAKPFLEIETCVILDSTWYANMLRVSAGNTRERNKRNIKLPPHYKTRKLHIIIGRESKAILSAKTSFGSVHDIRMFMPLVKSVLSRGYKLRKLLADNAYNSKENYTFCDDNDIEAFIDFKSTDVERRSLSIMRKKQLKLLREEPDIWHESYNQRPLVESVFSSMKRKGKNYLRSRSAIAQDCEMLLRVLWYNLNIVAKYY